MRQVLIYILYLYGLKIHTFYVKSTKNIGERKTRSLRSADFFLLSNSNSFFPQTPYIFSFIFKRKSHKIFNFVNENETRKSN
jgi:hypothetical protein